MAKKWQRYIYLLLHYCVRRFRFRNEGFTCFYTNKGKIAAQKAALFDWLQHRRQKSARLCRRTASDRSPKATDSASLIKRAVAAMRS